MKIKIAVIDLEIPPRVKKWALRIGIPLGVLFGGGAAAWAGGLLTWSSGQTLKASDLNANFAYLQSEITTLQGQVATPSAFRAIATTGTTIPSGQQTAMNFQDVAFDLNQEYTAAKGMFSPKNAGVYLISCEVWGLPSSTGGAWSATILVNGTQDTNQIDADDRFAASTTQPLGTRATVITQLQAGDQVTCSMYASGGGATEASFLSRNSFSASRLQ